MEYNRFQEMWVGVGVGGGGVFREGVLYFVFIFVVWRGIHFSIVFVVGL